MQSVLRDIQFHDAHLHLPSPNADGLARLLRHLDATPGMVGGNLILNTDEEIAFIDRHRNEVPPSLALVPHWPRSNVPGSLPAALTSSGWFKLHPILMKLTERDVPDLCASICEAATHLRGLIVHCFPWGTQLEHEISLPLLIALAQALLDTPILATHGGGYDAWRFRAHTASLRNVFYDFSVTAAYFEDSDLLRPLAVYLRRMPDRVVFGSDWPHGDPIAQFAITAGVAMNAGLDADAYESLMLRNAQRLWPAQKIDDSTTLPEVIHA